MIRKKFNSEIELLIKDIANQYIDIYLIVKKMCPKSFSKEQINIVYVQTEKMFNQYQCRIDEHKRSKKENKSNGTKPDCGKSYQ